MNDFIAINRRDSRDVLGVFIGIKRNGCILVESMRPTGLGRKCAFAQKGEPLPARKSGPSGL
jgi:hypothetical protein